MMRGYLVVCTVFLLFALPVAAKSDVQANWAVVAALSAGTQVEVHQRSGPTVHGKVASGGWPP